jgi:transcriptional regulator with XRE-family HTH domain
VGVPPPSKSSRIQGLRLERGLTQAELARRAGMSKRTLERLEANELQAIKLRHVVNIALVLQSDLYGVLEDAWLEYNGHADVDPPEPDALVRPPGDALPKPRRERAPRKGP